IIARRARWSAGPCRPVQLSVFVRLRRAPCSTLFPYTTLFRSRRRRRDGLDREALPDARGRARGLAHGGRRRSPRVHGAARGSLRSEEHTSELQSRENLVCRLLLEKKKKP